MIRLKTDFNIFGSLRLLIMKVMEAKCLFSILKAKIA